MDTLHLLTIAEVADQLRVHRATVSRLLKSGELAHIRIGSRRLIRYQDVCSFIENRIGNGAESRNVAGGVHG